MERALWIFKKIYGPMYNVRPVAVATGESAARTGTERRFLAMREVLLGDIPDGDDPLLAAQIHGEHPAYGGRRTLQDLLKL
jgi:hypothetical protein